MRRFAPALAAAAVIGFLAVGVVSTGAAAQPSSQTSSTAALPPDLFTATTATGATIGIDVAIDDLLLRTPEQVPRELPRLPTGDIYPDVRLQVAPADAPYLPIVLPIAATSLRVDGRTEYPSRGSTDSDWYFPVPASVRSAVLTNTAATDHAPTLEADGQVTIRTLHPTILGFLFPPPVTGPASAAGSRSSASHRKGSSTAAAVGLGASGIVVVVGGAAGLLTFGRRRAFYKADRAGRIVLVAPPLIAAEVAARAPEVPTRGAPQRFTVKILGWLEITTTKGGSEDPVAASGPISEIVVFLVLNPGRTFTSIQLREAIWGLGRSPLSSGTFRKYMVQLRKAFGSGVVVTERYRYELTAAVVSDLAMFRASVRKDDGLAGPEEALSLVRGPVLNGCFDGKKNSPFAWAVGVANDIEDEVTSVAHDLALSCLAAHDPDRAARALAQGLLCSATNLRLRLLELEVGSTLGGASELSRRLAAARAALAGFPEDVTRLEAAANDLGGKAFRS